MHLGRQLRDQLGVRLLLADGHTGQREGAEEGAVLVEGGVGDPATSFWCGLSVTGTKFSTIAMDLLAPDDQLSLRLVETNDRCRLLREAALPWCTSSCYLPRMSRLFLTVLSLSGAFILGCAAAAFVVPPARAGMNPQKWEYKCFEEGNEEKLNQKANEMGAQGWEMSSAAGAARTATHLELLWCFKRPLG